MNTLLETGLSNVVMASGRPDEDAVTASLIPSTQQFAIAFGAALSGVVAGNATNDNARLYINKHGRVLGKTRTKGKHAETQTEESWGVKLERGK